MTVDFRNHEKCETCGNAHEKKRDYAERVDWYRCHAWGDDSAFPVRFDGYCKLWEPREEREKAR